MSNSKYDLTLERVVRKQLSFVSAGVATEYINDAPVKKNQVLTLTRIALVNQTHSFTSLRVGVYSGGVFYPFEEQSSPAADTLYWTSDELIICSGENLRIELKGCTSGDIVRVYMYGILDKKKVEGA